MARVFIDGFEKNDLRLWDSNSGCTVVAVKSGMSGSYCADFGTGFGDNRQVLSKNVTARIDYYVKFRYWCQTNTYNPEAIISFYDSGICHLYLKRNAGTGNLDLYRGIETNFLVSGTASIVEAHTYLIELYAKIDDGSSGRFILKVDGLSDIDFTGDTRNAGNALISTIRFGYPGGGNDNPKMCIDDVVIDNANWPGDGRIQGLAISGIGSQSLWTPSVGTTNFVMINDIDDADFNYTNTNNNLDLFAANDLTGTISAVKCVQVQASARKQGTSTPQNLQLALKSGTTVYTSTDKALPSAYNVDLYGLWETNPATTNSWTEQEVDNAEFGYKATA